MCEDSPRSYCVAAYLGADPGSRMSRETVCLKSYGFRFAVTLELDSDGAIVKVAKYCQPRTRIFQGVHTKCKSGFE